MIGRYISSRARELEAKQQAISKSQAVIEFKLDGTIIWANDNFLSALGYGLDEVKDRHHSMFVEPSYRDSDGYRQFWATLAESKYQAAEYKRIGKGGREVWIQASYNPILDARGKPFKVVKFATDVTAQKLQTANSAGQIAAIGKSAAVTAAIGSAVSPARTPMLRHRALERDGEGGHFAACEQPELFAAPFRT